MRPNQEQKLEILKLEMGLIQGTFDKYDDLMWRNRNWFITIWFGAIGFSIAENEALLAALAVLVSIMYWIMEGTMRYQYWYKYVVRYRAIRYWINESEALDISTYDLTNHYGNRPDRKEKIKNSYLKLEPTLLFIFLLAGAIFILFALKQGFIGAKAI